VVAQVREFLRKLESPFVPSPAAADVLQVRARRSEEKTYPNRRLMRATYMLLNVHLAERSWWNHMGGGTALAHQTAPECDFVG
jgi:hypothetical protein